MCIYMLEGQQKGSYADQDTLTELGQMTVFDIPTTCAFQTSLIGIVVLGSHWYK